MAEDEDVFTAAEIIAQQEEHEAEAAAILGADDETICSFARGYVRQSLYACLTCSAPGAPAGVCLGCALKCHERHEIVELYTKRNFRCDCGTVRGGHCKFDPSGAKEAVVNEGNRYNHNFRGRYCVCDRPYPDPDCRLENEEMLQCIVCEDWYHVEHLGMNPALVPHADSYEEFICSSCMTGLPSLRAHAVQIAAADAMRKDSENTGDSSDTVAAGTADDDTQRSSGETVSTAIETGEARPNMPGDGGNQVDAIATRSPFVADAGGKKDQSCESTAVAPSTELPAFFSRDAREAFARDATARLEIAAQKVAFLLDQSDTLLAHETRARLLHSERVAAAERRAIEDSPLSRVQLMEAATAFHEMSTAVRNSLGKIAAENRTVTAADIKEMFQQLPGAKRRRVDE